MNGENIIGSYSKCFGEAFNSLHIANGNNKENGKIYEKHCFF